MNNSPEGALSGSLVGVILAVVAFLALVALWAMVRGTSLILWVLLHFPKNRAIWLVLLVFFATIAVAILSRGTLLWLPIGGWVATVVTAKSVQLHHQELFMEENSFGRFFDDVRHNWTPEWTE